MSNYFRITGYVKEKDVCFIMDSNGYFEKLWQFSSYLVQNNIQILEVSNDTKFQDVNIGKVDYDKDHLFLRATTKGKPEYINHTIDGEIFKAVKVGEKIYIYEK